MHVGFVGLGNLGAPMALNIEKAGFELGVWARRPESLAPFRDTSTRIFDDLGELAGWSDALHVCVFNDDQVSEVAGAALEHLAAGSALVIHSTIRPTTCAELAVNARARGVEVIDAPVSVVGKGGSDKALILLVGGEGTVVKRASPVLEAMGRLFHLGPSGSGLVFKALNNVTFGANLRLAIEALSCAEALGLDRGTVLDVLQQTTGRSGAMFFLAEQIDIVTPAHTAAGLDKDVGVFSSIVAGHGLATPGLLETTALAAAECLREIAARDA